MVNVSPPGLVGGVGGGTRRDSLYSNTSKSLGVRPTRILVTGVSPLTDRMAGGERRSMSMHRAHSRCIGVQQDVGNKRRTLARSLMSIGLHPTVYNSDSSEGPVVYNPSSQPILVSDFDYNISFRATSLNTIEQFERYYVTNHAM